MSRAASGKRSRPDDGPPGLMEADRDVLKAIITKESMGMPKDDIRKETRLTIPLLNRSLKTLVTKKLIKKVPIKQRRGNEIYIGINFEPSPELDGGGLYKDGKLDPTIIESLKGACLAIMRMQRVATPEIVHDAMKKRGVLNFDVSSLQIGEIMASLFLDKHLMEVKSTGMGDYELIPAGENCYRIATGDGAARGPRIGGFASIPCGACPRISSCTPDGLISPSTCVYYTKWLNLDF